VTNRCWRAALVAVAIVLPGSGAVSAALASPSASEFFDPQRGVLSFAKVLDGVLPSVVQITILSNSPPGTKDAPKDAAHQDNLRARSNDAEEMVASGSGVIIDAKNGYVLTNDHVVTDDGRLPLASIQLRVGLRDGREFIGQLVGHDELTDIAVVKIPADHLTAIPIADSAALQVGDIVLAIGYPLGLDQTVTVGVVSGLRRHLSNKQLEDFIQTDAAINHGNSGGPLIDTQGRLIGINTAIANPYGEGNIGLNFAVPTRIAMSVSVQLERYGEVNRGQIGIVVADLTPALAKALDAPVPRGALVRALTPGMPAAVAGVHVGDIIVRAGESEVLSTADLRTIIGLTQPGESIALTFYRGDREQQVQVKIEAPPTELAAAAPPTAPKPAPGKPDEISYFGATFRATAGGPASRQAGVVVIAVATGSPAKAQGLQPGDLIVQVNAHPTPTLAAFKAALAAPGAAAAMKIVRGNATRIAVFSRAKTD
jgi:Do/DeqQ family serine protease